MTLLMERVDRNVFRRYAGVSLPRHVSYPMPTWWHGLDADEASAMRRDSDRLEPQHDLSLYVHIPFCEALCKFCACNKVVQRKSAPNAAENTEHYLDALRDEICRTADGIDTSRPVRQVHWGGGSPTYLSLEQISGIQATIQERFSISEDAEVAMEIDPRHVSPEFLRGLRSMGFNRVSMGVQDFDEQVQQHVRRLQPLEQVEGVARACRESGFASVNFDLIYGLPYQTVETVRRTIEETLALGPDRVAFYHYAQVPQKVATQRGIDHTKLPESEIKLEMFLTALELFDRAGYVYVGLDHFARPDEALAASLGDGTIQRNFQGMTTGRGLRLFGAGVSAISHLTDVGFQQNVKDVADYVRRTKEGQLPVERGKRLTHDDRIRQALLNELYCTGGVRPDRYARRFDIDFGAYFAREIDTLHELEQDGLVRCGEDGAFDVTFPLGRVLMRNVAAVFDAYLDPQAYRLGEQACFSANA